MGSSEGALLIEIVIESLMYALLLFSIVTFVVGMVLLIAPKKIERLRALSDRWLTPRKSLKPLEIPRNSDPFIYRNHRWMGATAIILPMITFYLLLYSVADELPRNVVINKEHYLFWQWLFDSATLFLWITNLFAFGVGIVLFFRPSQLKRIEAVANRWLSTRQGLRRFDQSFSQLDELMLRTPKWTAIFLILGSLYIFMVILTFMLQHPDWLDLLRTQLYKV